MKHKADDTIPMSSSPNDSLWSALRREFVRAAEQAVTNGAKSPLQFILLDAKSRHLLTMTIAKNQAGWRGRTKSGNVKYTSVTLPLFVIAMHRGRWAATVRVDLDAKEPLAVRSGAVQS